MKDIREALNIKKSFVLNMKEIDYDRLIEFIKDMDKQNENYIVIEVDSDRHWIGYSTDNDNKNRYNKTNIGLKGI